MLKVYFDLWNGVIEDHKKLLMEKQIADGMQASGIEKLQR